MRVKYIDYRLALGRSFLLPIIEVFAVETL